MLSHVNPDTLFKMPGFSHIVVSPPGRLAFVAGQGAFDKDFALIGGGDLRAQTVRAFQNITLALEAVGAAPEDVISSTIYVVGLTDETTQTFVAAMNEALDGRPFPPNASTLVGVTRLGAPGMLIEISAIALIPS